MLPPLVIGQSPEAGNTSAFAVPGSRCRETGVAVVVAEIPIRSAVAVTETGWNVPLSSQAQVGTLTVCWFAGLRLTSVSGTRIQAYARSASILGVRAFGM